MKNFIIYVAILFLALSANAMTPLTESDLSNVSNPLSLSINPEQRINVNNQTNVWDTSDGFNQLLPIPSGLMIHFDLNLFEGPGAAEEKDTPDKLFSSFSWLWGKKDVLNKVHIFLIDPVTGKNITSSFSDNASITQYQILPSDLITWKNYAAIINAETVSAEDTNGNNINTQATATPSIAHTNDDTRSSNSPYRYYIMSGNTYMRDTYINKTNTTIQSGSWVDIKTR
jgi:hypothetical protein